MNGTVGKEVSHVIIWELSELLIISIINLLILKVIYIKGYLWQPVGCGVVNVGIAPPAPHVVTPA